MPSKGKILSSLLSVQCNNIPCKLVLPSRKYIFEGEEYQVLSIRDGCVGAYKLCPAVIFRPC